MIARRHRILEKWFGGPGTDVGSVVDNRPYRHFPASPSRLSA